MNPVVVRSGRGRTQQLRRDRGSVEVLVDSTDGARKVDAHINTVRAGTEPGPRHYHSEAENAYYVLSGEAQIVVGDEERIVSPGDFLFIPPGVPHSVHNNSSTIDLRIIEIYAPADIDFVEV